MARQLIGESALSGGVSAIDALVLPAGKQHIGFHTQPSNAPNPGSWDFAGTAYWNKVVLEEFELSLQSKFLHGEEGLVAVPDAGFKFGILQEERVRFAMGLSSMRNSPRFWLHSFFAVAGYSSDWKHSLFDTHIGARGRRANSIKEGEVRYSVEIYHLMRWYFQGFTAALEPSYNLENWALSAWANYRLENGLGFSGGMQHGSSLAPGFNKIWLGMDFAPAVDSTVSKGLLFYIDPGLGSNFEDSNLSWNPDVEVEMYHPWSSYWGLGIWWELNYKGETSWKAGAVKWQKNYSLWLFRHEQSVLGYLFPKNWGGLSRLRMDLGAFGFWWFDLGLKMNLSSQNLNGFLQTALPIHPRYNFLGWNWQSYAEGGTLPNKGWFGAYVLKTNSDGWSFKTSIGQGTFGSKNQVFIALELALLWSWESEPVKGLVLKGANPYRAPLVYRLDDKAYESNSIWQNHLWHREFEDFGKRSVQKVQSFDSDRDTWDNQRDACPLEPEDFDGFEDTDGCPDVDNDQDGLPDLVDNCPDEKEDYDGFRDRDGCPDLDNDLDGVPDVKDLCSLLAEDRDGYKDFDGCPDLDNDGDGLMDWEDECPLEAEDLDGDTDTDGCPDHFDTDSIPRVLDHCPDEDEDMDGFEDFDGCPDPDNDLDGIPDESDACPQETEIFDGRVDSDGCP